MNDALMPSGDTVAHLTLKIQSLTAAENDTVHFIFFPSHCFPLQFEVTANAARFFFVLRFFFSFVAKFQTFQGSNEETAASPASAMIV